MSTSANRQALFICARFAISDGIFCAIMAATLVIVYLAQPMLELGRGFYTLLCLELPQAVAIFIVHRSNPYSLHFSSSSYRVLNLSLPSYNLYAIAPSYTLIVNTDCVNLNEC